MTDARFEDGEDAPLRLRAETAQDLEVISALLQDAVLPLDEVSWSRKRRTFSALINRFRWEDAPNAGLHDRPFERVRAILTIGDADRVRTNGVDPADRDLVLSLLSLTFQPGSDGTGQITLVLAGDGEIVAEVECLNVTLTDVTRPYAAPSGRRPEHPK